MKSVVNTSHRELFAGNDPLRQGNTPSWKYPSQMIPSQPIPARSFSHSLLFLLAFFCGSLADLWCGTPWFGVACHTLLCDMPHATVRYAICAALALPSLCSCSSSSLLLLCTSRVHSLSLPLLGLCSALVHSQGFSYAQRQLGARTCAVREPGRHV